MNWSTINLATPLADASGLVHKLPTIEITPWTYSINEGQPPHTWLAFPNAVSALSNRLPSDAEALFVVAVAASSAKAFAAQCAALQAVFPLRQVAQWQRHAQALSTLETDKFIIDEPVSINPALDVRCVSTVADYHRKQVAQNAMVDAAGLSAADPLTELNAFASGKVAHDNAVTAPLPALSGGAGWRFYADSDIKSALVSGHPNSTYTLTALLAFVGSPATIGYFTELMP